MARTYRDIPQLSPQEIERFWSFVDKTPGQGPRGTCWIWKGGTHARYGYGYYYVALRQYYPHRVAYFLARGAIDNCLNVCHDCDVRSCCNPDHLWQGTHKENSQDMVRKGRSLRGRKRPNLSGDLHPARLHPETRPRGDSHPYTKIPDSDIPQIRARYAEGNTSLQGLADCYDVTKQCIRAIVKGFSRKHIV